MIKTNLILLVGAWCMFLALSVAVILGKNTSDSSWVSNFYFSLGVFLFSPSAVLLIIYLKKNHILEKKIYLFLSIEFSFMFFGFIMAGSTEHVGYLIFTSIPIAFFLFWYKFKYVKNEQIAHTYQEQKTYSEFKRFSGLSKSKKFSHNIKSEKLKTQSSKDESHSSDTKTNSIKNLNDYLQKSVSDLLKMSESEFLEFKSTLKWDIREEKANPDLIGESIKTIAGFLNNKGGILVIGYDDDNNVLYGLEKDYPVTSKKANYDGWQQFFINQVNERLGKEINHYFTIESVPHNGKTIARINVSKSPKPVFAKQNQKGGDFFVRIHGQTENLNPEDANKWISEHFSA